MNRKAGLCYNFTFCQVLIRSKLIVATNGNLSGVDVYTAATV
jgi:hypothetical protein